MTSTLGREPAGALAQRLTTLAAQMALEVAPLQAGRSMVIGSTCPPNSAGSKQLKRNAVSGKKIAKNAVTGVKVKNGTLLGADFKAGQLPAGPKGDTGDPGPQRPKGDTGLPGAKGDKADAGPVVDTSAFARAATSVRVTTIDEGGIALEGHAFSLAVLC